MVNKVLLTLNQLIGADLFLGYHISNWNPRVNYFLIGKYKYSNIFNMNYSYFLIKKFSSIILDLLIKKSRIWLVNENFSLFSRSLNFCKLASNFGELSFYNEKWQKGLLSNYKFVTFIKPAKFPHAIFVPNLQNNRYIVNEAYLINIPPFSIIDSIDNPSNIFLPLPGNSKSVKPIFFFYLLISKLVLYSRYIISSSFVFSLYNKVRVRKFKLKKKKSLKVKTRLVFSHGLRAFFFKLYLINAKQAFLFSQILFLFKSKKGRRAFIHYIRRYNLIKKKRNINKFLLRWGILRICFINYFSNVLKLGFFNLLSKSFIKKSSFIHFIKIAVFFTKL